MPELPKIERCFHDTVDLASGKIDTTPVARPLSAAERVERLARFGFRADPSIFAEPTHHLTTRAPYQSAPEAALYASGAPNFQVFSYATGFEAPTGQIWWRMPATFETEFMSGVNFHFLGVPDGPVVWSIVFKAYPYQNRTGVVVIEIIGHPRTEIEINMTVERTVDIGFVFDGAAQPNPGVLDTRVFWRPGLRDFVFLSVSAGSGLIVLDPTP
jgi:hypothetical protein